MQFWFKSWMFSICRRNFKVLNFSFEETFFSRIYFLKKFSFAAPPGPSCITSRPKKQHSHTPLTNLKQYFTRSELAWNLFSESLTLRSSCDYVGKASLHSKAYLPSFSCERVSKVIYEGWKAAVSPSSTSLFAHTHSQTIYLQWKIRKNLFFSRV